MAAITAHDAGAEVVVLEKAPFRGSESTRISFGICSCPTNVKDAVDYLGRIAVRNAAAEDPWS